MDNFQRRIVCIEYIIRLLLSMDDSQLGIIKAIVENMI